MGNINETIRGHVQRQFNLVKKSKKDYLVIDEAKKLTSLDEYPIDFKKLAVLFMLDVDKNGKFSSEDLMKFAEWCGSVTGHIKADQQSFKSELQAQCTLHMWKQINTARNGKEIFGDWFVRLFSVGHILKVPKYPNIHWVSVDTVSTIHELLSIKELYGIDCQQLIGLMQSVGEEKGLMSLDDEDLDDVIPIQVIHDFAVSFITGFLNMMSSFGFTREKYLTPTLLKESNNSANNSLSSPSNTSSPSNNSPVSVEGVGVGNGVGTKLTIKPEAFKLKDLSNNNNSTTITNNSSNNLDNNSSNNNTNSGKIVPSGFKLSLPVGKMNIPTNNNNTNNEQNISNKNATIKTEVKSQIMIPKLSMGISPTTIQNNNAPKSNDSETSGDDDYEDDHHFQKNNGNNNNNALDLQITPNTNVALKTISPNATVFLFDEQNNLEKLGERKGNFTSSDEEENFSEESDEEEYDDDDDIDINSPREAPKIHPALLQSQQQQQQQNFMPKPKVSLPSLGNANNNNNNNNNNGNEIPNNSSNSIKVNGIAMKKLKF
ncbi:hypothetical protein ABK040_011749 [Willaertia magna]